VPQTAQSTRLLALARSIADALGDDVVEAVVTGSVSRGVADDVSDIEMLVVTEEQLGLDACFARAADAGLTSLGSWGAQRGPTQRVSGYRDAVPIELICWSRAQAEQAVEAIFAGELSGTADALAHGVALRTIGLAAEWQERLSAVPDELARRWIDDAALTWGGFAAAGLLTIVRPGERLAMLERMIDDASRVVLIVFLLNGAWPPTLKRVASRTAELPIKPDRLTDRIEEALTEPDLRTAVLLMTELQADTVALAPDTPNVVRARAWLADAVAILRSA
jgi:hypothetical protein